MIYTLLLTLLVEGAVGDEIGAGPFEAQVAADDIDDVAGGTNLFKR